ncbi:hypothetical protein BKA63DRAFT_425286 [Paraphoma chrysanthemicola]|nr:hypothetical protein BKA63DRAFT_425286 [Paraphoma chrysanthemicola]
MPRVAGLSAVADNLLVRDGGIAAVADALFARDGGLHPPSEVLKSWPRPNHVDPEERGWEAPIALIIVLAITFIVYTLRMWARLTVAKNSGVDDLLMTFAMFPLIGLTVSAVLAVRVYGFQWHTWDQTDRTHITTREITMAIEITYLVSTTFIKVSILCFYRRMTGSLKNSFVKWVYGMIVFCIIYGILFTVLIIFTYSPVVGYFHLFDPSWRLQNKLTYLNEGAIVVACAIISTVQDLIICLLPVFLVWNLRMGKRQKAGLCAIFAIGLVTCVCGILRTYYATYIYYYTYDITWYAYYGWVWTVLEADLGMICASAPAMKVFFRRYFSGSTSRGEYTRSGSIKTPIQMSSRTRGKSNPQLSAHSATASRAEPEGAEGSGVPFAGIKVSQGLDIHVEERDDLSQKSYASTRNLTALPKSDEPGWASREWVQGCRTVCAALNPSSRKNSRSRSAERDLEHGPSTS